MRKAITMPEFRTAIQNKTTDFFSARELLELLNNSAEMATANGNETADLIKAIADNNKAENESICTDKCKVLIADRKSVVQGKSVQSRVDLGGRRIIKKKKK